jgi:hypothetical protein
LAPKFRLHIRQCHLGREVFGSLGKQLVYLGKKRMTLSTLNQYLKKPFEKEFKKVKNQDGWCDEM